MKITIVTGSNGLVGSEVAKFFHKKNFYIHGIDNDKRSYFFGTSASTCQNGKKLKKELKNYKLSNIDIRNFHALEKIFKKYKKKIKCIVHAAAQPSHDWAIKEPQTDYSINANGTLNLLILSQKYCKNAVFIQVSTNKVYGDTPNKLPIVERKTRYELSKKHFFYKGINEEMSIDNSTHSLFGVSKLSADLLVQEYGKNLKMKTGVFRLGCITGASHAGAQLHGFLSYLFKSINENIPYTIFGFKGKQVRDNIHAYDLASCFWRFYQKPRKGEVYNLGGSRKNSCSILEAIKLIEKITKKKSRYKLSKDNRTGDHIWYISDNSKFVKHYPGWKITKSLSKIILEMKDSCKKK